MNLSNLLRHISLKHLRLQKAQWIMAVCGISLGVAAMVSIDNVNRSVLHSFEDSITHVTGRAALQVTGAESGFPEGLLEVVQKVPGVEYAVPVIETSAHLADGTRRSLMILGVDVLVDHQIRDYSITDESADIPDPLLFLARPDSILMTRIMAEREGVQIDQPVRVQTVQGIKTIVVRGLLNPEGPARVAGGDIAVMDIYAAQLAFGKEGRIDRIDVSFFRGEDLETVKERIQKVVPEGYEVDTPAARTRQVEMLLSRFRKSVGLVSSMAMVVGMFLIYNAVSISVVQRRREIGILKALGARRAEIIQLFLGETVVISAFGSLLGVGVGLVLARLSLGAVAQSVTDMYIKTSVAEPVVSWEALVLNASIGVLASLVAALLPAVSAARITPVSAIRVRPYSQESVLFSRRIVSASGLFIVSSLVLLVIYRSVDGSSIFKSSTITFGAVILLVIGVSLLTPLFLKAFMAVAHRFVASWLGVGGRLAGLNLEKNIMRNAVAVAAIFFSITLFVSSANLIASTRICVFEWIDSIIRADLLIASGHPLGGAGGAPGIPMPGDLSGEIEKVSGVLSVESFRKGYLNFNGRKVLLESFDVALRMEYCPLMIAEGSREEMLRLLPDQDNVVVNEGFAARHNVKPGGSVVLPTPGGPVRFGVAAIGVAYNADCGTIWMDSHTYQRHWHDTLADMFEVRIQPGTELEGVKSAILERLGRERIVFVLPAAEFRSEVRSILNRSFLLNNAVSLITLIIAGLGIVVTMLASVLERTREIGVLRAVGMKRGQVAAVVILESGLIGIAGGLLGLATGILVGWINLEGFFRLDIGSSITYHIHYASLLWAILVSAILSALAGLYPARRAARINIVEALSYE